MNDIKSSRHNSVRTILRVGGPIILGVGGLFTVVGFGSFLLSFFRHSGPPVLFVCAFIGLPLLFIGSAMCLFGFVGAFARYVAAEQVPVAKYTINYMAEGTQDAIKTVARAAAQGVTEGMQQGQSGGGEQK